jgi:hypothetical protein
MLHMCTTEELHSIAAQNATGKEATELLFIPGYREVTLCSGKVAPSNVTVQDTKKGTKGSKTDYDDGNDEKASGSDFGYVVTATWNSRKTRVKAMRCLFPREDPIMMVYDGCPPPGRHHVSNLSLGTPTRCGWRPRNTRV